MASVRNAKKIYIANISRGAKDIDLGRLFEVCGRILSLENKGDYGFIEFQDVAQAEEAIRRFDGTQFMGKRIVVEPYVYRGGDFRYRPAAAPNPEKFRARNVSYRLYITGLDNSTSWQDVKDFARSGGRSVCYTDVYTRRGKKEGVIEYFRREDYEYASRYLDGATLHGAKVNAYSEREYQKKRNRESSRSHSREDGNNRRQHSGSRHKKRSHERRSRSNRKSRDRDPKRDDNQNKRSPSPNNNANHNNANSRNDKDKHDKRSRTNSRSPKRDSNFHERRIDHSRSHDDKKESNSFSTKQRNNRSKSPQNRSRSHSRTHSRSGSRNHRNGQDNRNRPASNNRRHSHSRSN